MEDQYFQKSWQAARFPSILTKFLILKTSFAGTFRNMLAKIDLKVPGKYFDKI